MDRRPLSLVLALGLALAVPAAGVASPVDALLAQSGSGGTLSDSPAGLTAQASGGTLSEEPNDAGGSSGSSSSTTKKSTAKPKATATASADTLPFTGSDPRITLLLGVAALLAGAGLRLRTGDARDY